ncbi:hypothetical protein PN36_35540 [Candidatus Thiomargarita nelsonii]|uniref:Uncharacterized protein n=1 Tax=Candidatus Thiomargarita nelsonii TaxID=1003181 RepID=A0A4E0RK76_9GAMM|nr:hypothetical protein PN36_35540 [Candidatus Thiomargarita nelsonii]
MKRLEGLLSQAEPAKYEPIQPSPKPVEKPIQSGQARIVQMREWWNQLDDDWKKVFKKAIKIENEPSDDELVEIVNLQILAFSGKWNNKGNLASLEPLSALTNLQTLDCSYNPLRQKTFFSRSEIDQFKKAVPNCQVYS